MYFLTALEINLNDIYCLKISGIYQKILNWDSIKVQGSCIMLTPGLSAVAIQLINFISYLQQFVSFVACRAIYAAPKMHILSVFSKSGWRTHFF